LRSCSAVNSPTRRVGLAPTFMSASLAQAPFAPVKNLGGFPPYFSGQNFSASSLFFCSFPCAFSSLATLR
jgi:hypothetical protein